MAHSFREISVSLGGEGMARGTGWRNVRWGSAWWGSVSGGECEVGECVVGKALGVCVVHNIQNRKQKIRTGSRYNLQSSTLVSYFCQPGPISLKTDSTAPKIAPFRTGAHG